MAAQPLNHCLTATVTVSEVIPARISSPASPPPGGSLHVSHLIYDVDARGVPIHRHACFNLFGINETTLYYFFFLTA
jgi:hypothetical protein